MSASVVEVVRVDTPTRSYDVVVGHDLLDEIGQRMLSVCPGESAMVVTDANVAPLYLQRVRSSLEAAGYRVGSVTIPAGEQHKRFSTFELIVESMAEEGLTRDSVVVALGGGVVGDMAGFAAASYMRGIKVVQAPTTLLAMVDSSVGGKTAIDLKAGKNLVGAFLQPSLVVADVACLRTLTQEVFADGLGEVVKHGVLADPSLLAKLEENPPTRDSDLDYLARIVARNVQIKRDVVNADEREHGLRQTLNLGHTLGHAIEAASGFSLGHGHCVAAGLCCVARGTEALGWTDRGLASQIERCIGSLGLPTDTKLSHETLLAFATHDKKRHGESVNLVVPERIGSCVVRKTSFAELAEVIRLGCGTSTQADGEATA